MLTCVCPSAENQPAAKRQKRSTVGANESEDEGALRAADAGGNTHQADKAASTASEAAEAQVGEIVQNSMKGLVPSTSDACRLPQQI